jgi:HSP20 family molecular chaperone IbpA
MNQKHMAGDSKVLQRRYIFTSRLEMTAFVSPIERWPDRNYTPEPLEYICKQTSDAWVVTAPMHGFGAEDVRIDLSRGHILILLREQDNGASLEYYCEVPIPPETNGKEAYIEITANWLTVRLNQKSGMLNSLAWFVRSLRNDLALCFSKDWTLESLDK